MIRLTPCPLAIPLFLSMSACLSMDPEDLSFEPGMVQMASSTRLPAGWMPFNSSSPWKQRLPADRDESRFSSQQMGVGALSTTDAEYGIKIYVAQPDDGTWTISYEGYNDGSGGYNTPNPLRVRGPSTMRPPQGTDGTVFLIDENRRYAYEMWAFDQRGTRRGFARYITRVDLSSNGVREGITGSGLPGIGGVLKASDLAGDGPIRHKLWAAAHPRLVYADEVWPALRHDAERDGNLARVKYGQVVALSKDYSFTTNPCRLSPFMQRIGQALKDYGAIVQDKGGDALQFLAEVDAVRDHIDIDYPFEMWRQFECLKRYMVRVNDPWR